MNKSNLVNQLIEAKTELEEVIKTLSNRNQTGPEGKICIKTVSNKPYFVKRIKGKVEYIPVTDTETIKELSQKLYNTEVINSAGRDIQQIDKCIELLNSNNKSVIDSIPEALHSYIDTDSQIDEKYAEKWASEKITNTNPKETKSEVELPNGIKVKSKSEWIIAKTLDDYKIPYYYEKPFDNYGSTYFGSPRYDLYPDFTCLNKRTGQTWYWEHLGKMDDPVYVSKNLNRIMNYASYNIYPGSGLIVTFEAPNVPFRYSYVSGLIEKFLK